MIIIYPDNSTIKFLAGIIAKVSERLEIKIDYPQLNLRKLDEVFSDIQKSSPSRSIIYLGHGTGEELNDKVDSTISIGDARRIFKGRKILLLSCNSSDFINSLNNQFEVGIGFGNIPTSKAELTPGDYKKYNYDDFKCISLFRESLVVLFANALIEAQQMNYTFRELYDSIKLRVNKAICRCSLSKDKNERLLGELLFDLRIEMHLTGNWQSTIN